MALLLASRALSMLPPTMPPDPPGCVRSARSQPGPARPPHAAHACTPVPGCGGHALMSSARAVRRSDIEWRNYQGDTCATYSANKWCEGGKLTVPAMGGPIMGSPEWACCACNDRRVPPDTASVTQIIFYATHNVEDIDRQMLVRYTQELTPVWSGARVWTLLYDQHEKWRDLTMTSAWLTDLFFPDSPTPMCVWSLESLNRRAEVDLCHDLGMQALPGVSRPI